MDEPNMPVSSLSSNITHFSFYQLHGCQRLLGNSENRDIDKLTVFQLGRRFQFAVLPIAYDTVSDMGTCGFNPLSSSHFWYTCNPWI